jgi:hypothetical protein
VFAASAAAGVAAAAAPAQGATLAAAAAALTAPAAPAAVAAAAAAVLPLAGTWHHRTLMSSLVGLQNSKRIDAMGRNAVHVPRPVGNFSTCTAMLH